jgi:CheY-like chemotaxis protein
MTSNNMRRILLVDDEEDITLVFELMLRKEGYIVDAFTHPNKALSAFKLGYYDLIILDYRMAGLNGLEFILNVRKVDRLVKALLLTAWERQSIGDEVQKLFVKVLSKPLFAEVLIKEVGLALA